jgi:hypothetical protein
MKVAHDEKSDSPIVILNDDNSVAESDEDQRGVILDCDKDGNLVSPEVLGSSSRLARARKIEQPGSERVPPRWPHCPPFPLLARAFSKRCS